MTREQYESLKLESLRGIARTRGLKGCSKMKKAELVEAMLRMDAAGGPAVAKPESAPEKAGDTSAPADKAVSPAPEKAADVPVIVNKSVSPAPEKAEAAPAPVKQVAAPAPVAVKANETPVQDKSTSAPAPEKTESATAAARADETAQDRQTGSGQSRRRGRPRKDQAPAPAGKGHRENNPVPDKTKKTEEKPAAPESGAADNNAVSEANAPTEQRKHEKPARREGGRDEKNSSGRNFGKNTKQGQRPGARDRKKAGEENTASAEVQSGGERKKGSERPNSVKTAGRTGRMARGRKAEIPESVASAATASLEEKSASPNTAGRHSKESKAASPNMADERSKEAKIASPDAAAEHSKEIKAPSVNAVGEDTKDRKAISPSATAEASNEANAAVSGTGDAVSQETEAVSPDASAERAIEEKGASPIASAEQAKEEKAASSGVSAESPKEVNVSSYAGMTAVGEEGMETKASSEPEGALERAFADGIIPEAADAELAQRKNAPQAAAEAAAEPEPAEAQAASETAEAQPGAETGADETSGTRAEGIERPGQRPLFLTGNSSMTRGILEVLPDGFGFLRSENFLSGDEDVYVSPTQIRRFNLKTGDMIEGIKRDKGVGDKNGALLFVSTVNTFTPDQARRRPSFENMTPVFPYERIRLEQPGGSTATRVVDLISPIGKGQRGMIVSPPKAGKTTLLKDIAKSILTGDPDAYLIILLVDERPEEVTDMKESVTGKNVEVIYSTFDEQPEHHMRVAEMVIERARRLVEHRQDVIILLDSITRLTRAYNLLVPPSGRTLSGGLDPAALYAPKRFFGAARKMREGGSLTILATALVDTGSKMDDVVYEEFKGTGNMELILDRKLQERRIFPAIDITKSGTRREDLLLTPEELRAVYLMRRRMNGAKPEEAIENILNAFSRSKTNEQVVNSVLAKWNQV